MESKKSGKGYRLLKEERFLAELLRTQSYPTIGTVIAAKTWRGRAAASLAEATGQPKNFDKIITDTINIHERAVQPLMNANKR